MSTGTSSGPSGLGAGGGECGALVRSLDWSRTPLGPAERWPPPLRTAAAICLESRSAMGVFWGPDLVAIYNDAYAPVLGAAHPSALGRPLRDVRPQIGDLLDDVLATGRATRQEDRPLLLDRGGVVVEAYFSHSLSPIRDETGAVAGIFAAVHETTERVLGTRRLQVLASLGEALAAARTEAEVAAAAIEALSRAEADVAFAALYLLDEDGGARFAGACGTEDRWAELAAGAGGGERVGGDGGALLLDVGGGDGARPAAALVLGTHPGQRLDEDRRGFLRQIARQLATALSGAAGVAAAQRRADALAAHDRARTELVSSVSHERPIVLPSTEDGRPEVLVADADADLRAYLARLLEPDYVVRTAVDGADALQQIAERPPDLVLTDAAMPRVDGFELLASLREDPRTRRLPVIVLSARAGEEATVEGLDAGADDYLVKPFSGPELLARVHANLEVTRLRDALAGGERERAREMEDVALTLQRSLLPRALPDVLGTELCGRYVPASESLEIGGDFYDATALGDGRLVITIGDVAGHGVLAAAVMGQVRQAVRAYAFEGHTPAGLMDRLDLLVSDSGLAMTTCLCGIFDPATGMLRFANAGHPPPLVRRADGTVERATEGLSHPLGVTMSHRHVEAELTLAVGEVLLLYTDGLVERRGEIIDVGIDRLAGRLATGPTSAADACERIVAELEDDLADDVALLAVTRTPMADEQLHAVIPAHPNRLADVRRRLAAWLSAHGASDAEANDIVLAAHEAAMNAIEHAYGPGDAEITVSAAVHGDGVEIAVHDSGRWRESRSEYRGRGHSIMSALMDDVSVDTGPTGSTVRLRRRLEGAGGE